MTLFLIFQYGLVSAFVVLLGTFLFVMVSESAKDCVSQLLGLYTKNGILKFLGIGMGGVLLALQALMSYKRAKALEDTANAQAEAAKAQATATEEQAKANENTEKGQRQERLKNAIEHLGRDNASVRLGGAYELFHLAQDTKDLRQTVLDILCAHIRRTTGEAEYRKTYKSQPSEEIQSLLTLLFVQEHGVFKGLHINLQGSWLNGANLQGARLRKAHLAGAYLCRTVLGWAHLQGAILMGAYLQEAILGSAHMQGSFLLGANMQAASLDSAQMQGSILYKTELQGASLKDAKLQGITMPNVDTARKDGISLQFAERMMASIGQESNLSGAIGIGPNSNAITGAYTAEEAEQWIAEYNEAMSEVPAESDN